VGIIQSSCFGHGGDAIGDHHNLAALGGICVRCSPMEYLRTASHVAMIGLGLLASVAWTGFLSYELFALVVLS
jgi:hypothetical protein